MQRYQAPPRTSSGRWSASTWPVAFHADPEFTAAQETLEREAHVVPVALELES
jgi:hypothetical protein